MFRTQTQDVSGKVKNGEGGSLSFIESRCQVQVSHSQNQSEECGWVGT